VAKLGAVRTVDLQTSWRVSTKVSVEVLDPPILSVLVTVTTMLFEKPSFAKSFVLTIKEPSTVENVITAVVIVEEPASVKE